MIIKKTAAACIAAFCAAFVFLSVALAAGRGIQVNAAEQTEKAETEFTAEIVTKEGSEGYQSFGEALSAWESGTSLRLLAEVKVETVEIAGEKTLDLNGFSLCGDGSGPVLRLLPNSALTVAGEGRIEGGKADCGGGIYAENAQLNLLGGKIANNAAKRGGGIYLKGSELAMTGGAVEENTADYGGGIYLFESSATVQNARISGNEATLNGGGFYLWGEKYGSSLNLYGGAAIEKNRALEMGGGISVWAGGCAYIDDCLITENEARKGGGGVFLQGLNQADGRAVAKIGTGAQIARNRTQGCGGGIEAVFGGILEMRGGRIFENTADMGGGIGINAAGYAAFGGDCFCSDNTLSGGEACNVFAEQADRIEICADFTGRLGFSVAESSLRLGSIACGSLQGLFSDSEEEELFFSDKALYLREKGSSDDSVFAGAEENAGGAEENSGGESGNAATNANASTREGERAIAIMIVIAAAAALLFIVSGFAGRIFRRKNQNE